jgi:subtilisin family serine protease
MAPGGGTDHRGEMAPRCKPGTAGPPIAQVTLARAGNPGTLGVPLDYVGTSMAAAHVTGIAAMAYASGVLGKHPSASLLAAYLVRSTRDLGPKGRDDKYGAGLIDAGAAVNRTTSRAAVRGAKRAVAHAAAVQSQALPVAR